MADPNPTSSAPNPSSSGDRSSLVGRFFGIFRPSPAIEPIADQAEVNSTYRYWRTRVLYTSMTGYAIFYFLRKNLSVAMPAMEEDLGITKADLGLFLTLHGLVYGASKFFNGFLGDRSNPRYFMAVGLILSAVMNVFFGLSSAVVSLGLFWLINGYFQGMGFPPCARTITHWFSPSERATKFAIWNTSHSIGAAAVLVLTGYLIQWGFGWRMCFFVPAGIAAVCAVFILNRLRDTPASLGLPPVEEYRGEQIPKAETRPGPDGIAFRQFVIRHLFRNRLLWIVAIANFFVYVVRYTILDWGPTFLKEAKGVEIGEAGFIVACYEIGGIVGMLVSGVVTDRLFKSHAGRACVVYMVLCTVLVMVFWKMPVESVLLNSALLAGIGFFIYGPQCLVGVMAANLGTKRAAATAIGFTGLFGYGSTILSGWGLGMIVGEHGWNAGFRVVAVCSGIAVVFFVLLWNVSAKTELEVIGKDS